jgi:hypothetical protein
MDDTSLMTQIIAWSGLGLAVYGAILSTYTVMNQSHRKVKVVLDYKLSDDFIPLVRITATNMGNKTVIIEKIGVKLPNGERVEKFSVPMYTATSPREIAQGNKCAGTCELTTILEKVPNKKIQDTLTLRPYCIDTLGKKYTGSKFVYHFETMEFS